MITSPTQKSDTARDSTNQLQVTWRLFLVVIKKITNPLPKTVKREIIIRKDQYQVIWGSREKCFCKGWLPISVVLFIALEIAINGWCKQLSHSGLSQLSLLHLCRFLFSWMQQYYERASTKYLKAIMKLNDATIWRKSIHKVAGLRKTEFNRIHTIQSSPFPIFNWVNV